MTRPGVVCETTGSCLAVSAVMDGFIPYDPDLPITCQNHAVAGRYTVLLWSQSAGMTLKWFAAKFYPDVPELEAAFQRMDAEAERIPLGCAGLTMLPHLTGLRTRNMTRMPEAFFLASRWNMAARILRAP